MKVRNLPYDQLNDMEQEIASAHWKECISDEGMTCKDDPKEQTVEGFWERHREADTDDGEYDGWFNPCDHDDIADMELDIIHTSDMAGSYLYVKRKCNSCEQEVYEKYTFDGIKNKVEE